MTEDLKKNKVLNTYENGSRVMYLLQEKPFTPDSVFKIAERAVPRAKTSKCKKIVVEICENPQPKKEEGKDEPVQEEKEVPKCPKEVLAQLPLAFRLANYKFEHKTVEDEKNSNVEEVTFTGAYASDIYKSELFSFYDVMGQAKNNARDLANGRPNMLNTEYFLEKAKLLAAEHPQVRLKYIYGDELEKEGLRLHHAVGRASKNPPILINLTFMNNPDTQEVHSLVGKGLTFDAGGLHVKPYGSMEDMYMDKGGASAVLASFKALVKTNMKINVTCTIGMAENFISNNSYRPSDIITSHKGLTVEVLNTDAEGRLVLADAMSWTQSTYPQVKSLIELSTLTGAIMVALGERTAGIFGNKKSFQEQIVKAGETVQEPLWRMPIVPEVREGLKGSHSDLKNITGNRYAGSSAAAAFLERFVNKGVDWAHLDIAGAAMTSKPFSVYTHGCTGFGVGTILQHYRNVSKSGSCTK